MRILITEKTMDLPALAASLARKPAAQSSMLEQIAALNPWVADVQRLAVRTLLILPDTPDLKAKVGISFLNPALLRLLKSTGRSVKTTRAATRAKWLENAKLAEAEFARLQRSLGQ